MNYDSCTMWPDSTAYVFRPSFAEQAFPVLRSAFPSCSFLDVAVVLMVCPSLVLQTQLAQHRALCLSLAR